MNSNKLKQLNEEHGRACGCVADASRDRENAVEKLVIADRVLKREIERANGLVVERANVHMRMIERQKKTEAANKADYDRFFKAGRGVANMSKRQLGLLLRNNVKCGQAAWAFVVLGGGNSRNYQELAREELKRRHAHNKEAWLAAKAHEKAEKAEFERQKLEFVRGILID